MAFTTFLIHVNPAQNKFQYKFNGRSGVCNPISAEIKNLADPISPKLESATVTFNDKITVKIPQHAKNVDDFFERFQEIVKLANAAVPPDERIRGAFRKDLVTGQWYFRNQSKTPLIMDCTPIALQYLFFGKKLENPLIKISISEELMFYPSFKLGASHMKLSFGYHMVGPPITIIFPLKNTTKGDFCTFDKDALRPFILSNPNNTPDCKLEVFYLDLNKWVEVLPSDYEGIDTIGTIFGINLESSG
nr:hypothetical protein [Abalone asfa-like virus]